MKVLQNPPTCQSCPYKQASIHYGNPFERDFICNNKIKNVWFIKFTKTSNPVQNAK